MNTLINETTTTRYAIKVNGVIVSVPFISKSQAENALMQLSESQQPAATIVTLTENGQEMLMG